MATLQTRDQFKICREEWFKDHKATMLIGDQSNTSPYTLYVINWQKPTSWNYGCRFIIHAQWLCVVGDLGEATYQWGECITLEFLGKLDFDYFHGKCRASPSGSKFRQWDPDTAKLKLKEYLAEDSKRAGYFENVDTFDKFSMDQALHRAHDDGLYTDDAAYLSECGYIPDPMAVGHFVGLQMAIKQLLNPVRVSEPQA